MSSGLRIGDEIRMCHVLSSAASYVNVDQCSAERCKGVSLLLHHVFFDIRKLLQPAQTVLRKEQTEHPKPKIVEQIVASL